MDLGFRMHAERTPNPNSIKWVLGQQVVDGAGVHFDAAPGEDVSPLGARLFAIHGVTVVFFAANFITVTKRDDVDWTDIAQPIVDAIKDCLGREGGVVGPAYVEPARAPEGEVISRIRRILEEEVRPQVARDGGDVVFAGFRDGIVELYMQGSCSGCPSSAVTLKHGIEARLMQEIPEVQGVAAL